MTPAEAALQRVQTLYVLQTKLQASLDGNLRNPGLRREIQSDVRAFGRLLGTADWRYMGGMDVMDSLKELHGEARKKLRSLPAPKARKAKRATRAKRAKKR